jgi:hypothetical protein
LAREIDERLECGGGIAAARIIEAKVAQRRRPVPIVVTDVEL